MKNIQNYSLKLYVLVVNIVYLLTLLVALGPSALGWGKSYLRYLRFVGLPFQQQIHITCC